MGCGSFLRHRCWKAWAATRPWHLWRPALARATLRPGALRLFFLDLSVEKSSALGAQAAGFCSCAIVGNTWSTEAAQASEAATSPVSASPGRAVAEMRRRGRCCRKRGCAASTHSRAARTMAPSSVKRQRQGHTVQEGRLEGALLPHAHAERPLVAIHLLGAAHLPRIAPPHKKRSPRALCKAAATSGCSLTRLVAVICTFCPRFFVWRTMLWGRRR